MSLHTPYFFLKETETGTIICHNCDGGIGFMATTDALNEKTKALIELAIEEGKRRKSDEILNCLGLKNK